VRRSVPSPIGSMPVIISVAPQFWHLRLSMIFRVGAWAPPVSGGSVTGLSATDAWHRAEPVVRYVQHLFLEGLVKMDHFQKKPPLNLKRTTGTQGDQRWPAQNADEWGVPTLWTIRSCEQFYTDSSLEFLGNRMVRNTKAKRLNVSIQL